jgi:hypothetical protein
MNQFVAARSPIPMSPRASWLSANEPVQDGRIESCAGTHRSGIPNNPVSRHSSA